MGRVIDQNHRFTQEERDYLEARGRSYLFAANERRFGTNENPREPDPHEQENSNAISPFYNTPDREAAVYDVGGAPLPGTVLDYNTGRVADRDNGVFVEYSGPAGHTASGYDLSEQLDPEFEGRSDDDDDIDIDIVDSVLAMNVAELKEKLESEYPDVEISSKDKKEDLQNKLAIAWQDARDDGKEPVAKTNDSDESGSQKNEQENANAGS